RLSGDNIFKDNTGYFAVRANNCEFWTAVGGGDDISLTYTNCFFFESPPSLTSAQSPGLTMDNCTVEGGTVGPLTAQHQSGTTWPVQIYNCAFDRTTITVDTNGLVCDYNSFLTNANRLPINGSHDVTNIISYNW